ncbi:MAG: TlpA family protein disulfide reductase [Phycisphaerae bacterium]|nr:TlpA family protein disulfide reductase [Phycisphaerae bacterium]NUQ47660.1 TlpA family protein disulfide reductase [Phycisphaerae bacterium]
MNRRWGTCCVSALCIGGAWALAARPNPPAPGSDPKSAASATSAAAPSSASAPARFQVPHFGGLTLDGEWIEFPDSFRDRLVLVVVWASWCPHCRKELPYWKQAYDAYHDRGFELLGISVDASRRRTEEQLREFLATNDIRWPQIYQDAQNLSLMLAADYLPMIYLVDGRTGRTIAAENELRLTRLSRVLARELPRRRPAGAPATTSKAVHGGEIP